MTLCCTSLTITTTYFSTSKETNLKRLYFKSSVSDSYYSLKVTFSLHHIQYLWFLTPLITKKESLSFLGPMGYLRISIHNFDLFLIPFVMQPHKCAYSSI